MHPARTASLFCLTILLPPALPAAPVLLRPGDDLAAAVRQARAGERPAVLQLASGGYLLTETLTLGAEDTGLTIEAAPGAVPVITGSPLLTGWTLADPARGVWQLSVPDAASPSGKAGAWPLDQLFLNGGRLPRARTPDTGWLISPGSFTEGRPWHFPVPPGLALPDVLSPDAELIFTAKWITVRTPVSGWEPDKRQLRLDTPTPESIFHEGEHWFAIENTPESLTSPGEWQFERGTGTLRLIAPDGIAPDKAEIRTPRLTRLLHIDGADRVTLRGLTFSGTASFVPPDHRPDPQAAAFQRGAIVVNHSRGGVIEHCQVANAGGYGLDLGAGAVDWAIRYCSITEPGAGGIRLGEQSPDGPPCGQHQVSDCRILRYGRLHPAGCGIILFQTGGNRILHNEITGGSYTGISVGWTWGYQESPCRDNEIGWNHISDLGHGVLSDMGGIYTLGPQPGTRLHHNWIHDITRRHYGGWGLYTDEGSTGIVLENNIIARCQSAGFHQHYGRENVVQNNLFADCEEAAVARSREEAHLSFTFARNVVIQSGGQPLSGNWSNGHYQFLHNVWWDTGGGAAGWKFAGKTWADWQASGQDEGSVLADPQLADPAHPEKGLAAGSPATALGFQAIDLTTAGPRD